MRQRLIPAPESVEEVNFVFARFSSVRARLQLAANYVGFAYILAATMPLDLSDTSFRRVSDSAV
jgi:hypothetical protein